MANTTSPKTEAKKNILIIEDEGEIALILDLILSEKQYQLDYANNLLVADQYLEKETPAVVLLDNKLPDGYGVDFISYLKKKYPETRIIMISGYGHVRDIAMENGADLFFEKPFSADQLCKAIDGFYQAETVA